MRISSDALTFNDLLEEAQTIEAEFLTATEPIELGPEPEAARQFQEALKVRFHEKPPRSRLRLRKGDPEYSSLTFDEQMWLVIKGLVEQRKDPFHFSALPDFLELETWKPRDAMLILAGIDPVAALVEWSYDNFLGAKIERPKVKRANWFSSSSDLYDQPLLSDFDDSPAGLRHKIRQAQAEERVELVAKWESELSELERWASDPRTCFVQDMLTLRSDMLHRISRRWFTANHDAEAKHSPEYFVRWAEARGFNIEWAKWAREHQLIDQEIPATQPPYFDADSEDYPELLHIAVRAWEYARERASATPKKAIVEFVSQRYPHVSEGARDAIALVANWKKTGGRPKAR
jgi:hypothetical protein